MYHRIVWPIAGLLGVAILALSIRTLPGQGPGPMPYMMGQVGRFVVAHATEKQIVILDTSTGQLYKASSDDFKKFSELPKTGTGVYPAYPSKDKEKDKGPLKDKDKVPLKDKDVGGPVEKKDLEKKDTEKKDKPFKDR
jgi:hypothetical protein